MFNTEDTYEVVIFSIGDTKAGTKMGKLQLKNTVDDTVLNCILWEETLNRFDSKIFRTGNLVRIVSASFNEKYNNCLVSALELIKEAKLGLEPAEIEKYWTILQSYIDKIKNTDLKNFVAEQFSKYSKEFKIMPAAKLMHHNYIGGLLVHTVECAQYAELNLKTFAYKTMKMKSMLPVYYMTSAKFLNTQLTQKPDSLIMRLTLEKTGFRILNTDFASA